MLATIARAQPAATPPSVPPIHPATQALVDSALELRKSINRQTEATALLKAERLRCQKQGWTRDEIYVLNALAWLAWERADYVRTDEWALEAVRVSKRSHMTIDLGDTYFSLGVSAQEQQDKPRAIRFYREALRYSHQHSEEAQIKYQQSLTMLGNIYLETGEYRVARTYLRQALAEARRVHQPLQEFALLSAWGSGLRNAQPDTARILAEQALQLARTALDDDQARAINYAELVLMQIAQVQQRWPEVLRLGQRVLAVPDSIENIEYRTEALVAVAEALRHLGQPAAAYDSLASSLALTDTLRSQAKAEELARAQAKLGAVEQEARIHDLEQKRRIATLESDRAANRLRGLLGVAGGLFLLLLGGAYAYWRLRQSRAAVALSEARATAANDTKDRLMSIIGHDLRGPVANFQQALLLVRFYADHPAPAEQRSLADDLGLRAQRLAGLLDNLLFWGSSQRNEVRNHPEALDLKEQIGRAAALYGPMAAAKSIQIRQVLPDALPNAWADATLVSTLLRNLISNAVKFTPAGGEIILEVAAGPVGRLTITVRDTGVGLTPDQLAHLFDVRANRSTRGTAHEQGTGLGLLVCQHFAELLGSQLTVQSQPGQGAAFTFSVAEAPTRIS